MIMASERFKTHLRLLPLLLLAGVAGGCGGGGDDEDAGFGGGADASGIWLGNVDVDSGPQNVPAMLIVRSNGTVYMDTDIGLLVGTAQTSGNAFSAGTDGYSYNGGFPDGADFSLNGTVAAGNSLTGAFSGSGQSGTFEFSFNTALSALTAALPTVAGTYTAELTIRDDVRPVSVTIASNGDLTGSGGGCTLTGKVSVLDSARNVYSWNATLAGCDANGSASGIGIAPQAGAGAGFHLAGTIGGGAISLSTVD
jgi:hypothetical protein